MTFQKILCPTDFSEASYQSLQQAVELASNGQTEICVIHVEPAYSAVTPLAGIAPDARSEAARNAEVIKNLGAVLDERVPVSVRSRPILKQGEAGEQIVHTAREEGTDLIVLTTHGAGGLQPSSLGTVAEYVVHHAPCAVLTISGPAGAELNLVQLGANIKHSYDAMPAALQAANGKALYLDGD